ncbi:MAG TPA: MFS transporter [Gemmatimonadales bacterium]|nr:MFS transporter [Gemmatimonadales bacterium]
MSRGRQAFALSLLFGLNFMNFYDRQVVWAIGERIKLDWRLSDGQLGALNMAFILLYAVVGLAFGRWADRGRRRVILGTGAILWSAFTALSGVAWSFGALFLFRIGVGVGEASCAPAANSLLGDLFPSGQRGRAISLFMLGLPLGGGASFLVSGAVAQLTGGWRPALFVAALPGLLLGALAFLLPEPARGAAEPRMVAAAPLSRTGALELLRIPTLRWIIVSGALLNLILYALTAFLASFLIRYHGLDIAEAGRAIAVLIGVGGSVGMLAGGWLGDRVARHGVEQRLRLVAATLLIAAPAAWLALQQPRGAAAGFLALFLPANLLFYTYYSSVYATIQEVVEPGRRATAMAVYFLVFYFATAAGLYGFGRLSDLLASRGMALGLTPADAAAQGIHGALYSVPIICLLLTLVLWAGSRTVPADHAAMQARLAGAAPVGHDAAER